VRNRREKGIALAIALVVLLLISIMIAGLAWLVMGDQKLGGNNADRQRAFYGAEAGLESLTASLQNAFNAKYALTASDINALTQTPPSNVPGIQYVAPGGSNGSGYVIGFTPNAQGNPASSFSTLTTGPYAGLVALSTKYNMAVTAKTAFGSETKLQRKVQTVAIPLFQFGIFSQGDLDFFAEPPFNFGGRVHTNGNLWLAEFSPSTLTISSKVTAAGELITSNLENGVLTSSGINGPLQITTNPGSSSYANLLSQSPSQSVTGTSNSVGSIGPYNSAFAGVASGVYNGNIGVKETGVKPLNLSIATPNIGGQTIDLIRRPVPGENTSNPAKLSERYYSQVSLRILLSDYGTNGTCNTTDIKNLPALSANGSGSTITPVDLATLAWDTSVVTAGTNGPPYNAAPSGITAANVGASVLPLPVSNASSTTYTASDGYWVKQYFPTITGCLKIDYQSQAGGSWTDVTWEILNLGYTGRNINPLSSTSPAPPALPALPSTQVKSSGPTLNTGVSTIACTDPSSLAVIRLARVRDNPRTAASTNSYCGTNAIAPTALHGADYWPNVLFDSREGLLRDISPAAGNPTLAGAMYYVELDAANLAKWFKGTIGSSGTSANNTTGYSIYFSDRRGEQPDPNPPASVGGTNVLTGGYGYDDFTNPSNTNGCPNGSLDQGEDMEGDYNSSGIDTSPVLRTYGNILASSTLSNLWPISISGSVSGTQLGGVSTTAVTTLETSVLANNPYCSAPGLKWPFATANAQNLRENPPIFFRRALKIVDGSKISTGTCNGVTCGLTITSENPVYVQGDYNNDPTTDATLSTPSTDAHVGTSIIADAVTALSNNWNDVNSFISPYNYSNRMATATTYRFAMVGGQGVPFLQPAGSSMADPAQGTDGGVHNLMRYLENWNTTVPSYYLGSMVSMYYDHQAVGIWKCCGAGGSGGAVYNPPQRNYKFDTDFLTPSLLPPLTPMLRAINTIGFTQSILPTQ
jgi:hypothetical protein